MKNGNYALLPFQLIKLNIIGTFKTNVIINDLEERRDCRRKTI